MRSVTGGIALRSGPQAATIIAAKNNSVGVLLMGESQQRKGADVDEIQRGCVSAERCGRLPKTLALPLSEWAGVVA